MNTSPWTELPANRNAQRNPALLASETVQHFRWGEYLDPFVFSEFQELLVACAKYVGLTAKRCRQYLIVVRVGGDTLNVDRKFNHHCPRRNRPYQCPCLWLRKV